MTADVSHNLCQLRDDLPSSPVIHLLRFQRCGCSLFSTHARLLHQLTPAPGSLLIKEYCVCPGLIAFWGTPALLSELHTSESNRNVLDLFHDPWAPRNLRQSYCRLSQTQTLFSRYSRRNKLLFVFAEVCAFLFPPKSSAASRRTKSYDLFCSGRDPGGTFSEAAAWETSSLRGWTFSNSLHLFLWMFPSLFPITSELHKSISRSH